MYILEFMAGSPQDGSASGADVMWCSGPEVVHVVTDNQSPTMQHWEGGIVGGRCTRLQICVDYVGSAIGGERNATGQRLVDMYKQVHHH